MRNAWLLLKIQLSALLGFNKIIHLRDKRERRKKMAGKIAIGLCMLMLLPSFGMYAFMMGMGMKEMGQIGLFPGMTLACLCVMTLFSSISMAHGTLFAFRDYDMIMSLPVKNSEIAMSRLLLAYVTNTLFDFLIMIPCGAVYVWFARPAASFYPIYILTMFAAPVVPMMVGSLIGVILARVMASIKGGKYFQMIGATALSLCIMSMSMNMESMIEGGIFGDIGVLMSNVMNRIYPLTGMYVSAVRDLSWGATVLFVAIAAAALFFMALLLGRALRSVNTALTTTRAKRNFRMRELGISSPLMALYKKELRRYLSSPVYLFNTAFGLIMALVGVGALIVKGRELLNIALVSMELMGVDDKLIAYGLGYIAAFLIVTCCTTSCSISLEGRNLWLVQSLPVSGFEVLMAKLMVNLTLTIPTSLVIGLGAGLTLRLGVENTLMITAMTLGYSLMSAAMGLMVNVKNHNFEWTTDAVVVKQSAAVGISMLINMLLILVPGALTFVFIEYAQMTFWLTVAAMTAIFVLLLSLFRKCGDRWIHAL